MADMADTNGTATQETLTADGKNGTEHVHVFSICLLTLLEGTNPSHHSGHAMQALSEHSRELIQLIKKLEALRIQSGLNSLPKFVMTGDQSAGKSSITEALTGISLPRKAGTCTRCPYQITTSARQDSSQAWTCSISLNCSYGYTPGTMADRGDTNSFEDWTPKEATYEHFAMISEKDDLELKLILAHLAILNPTVPGGLTTYSAAKDLRTVPPARAPFSPNVIALEIEGPDLPELSFFDLPGAINSPDNPDEQYLYGFIERLLKSYIGDDQAHVLVACAVTNDIENCTALRYIRECNASSRCMGVLTKPDLMSNDDSIAHTIGLMLQGKKQKLGNGWHVAKLLGQKELEQRPRISHEEARRRENEFFRTSRAWAAFSGFSDRMGIPALQSAVSRVLTTHILHELPAIVQNVDGLLADISNELEGFPQVPRSPTDTVSREARNVQEAIVTHIRGDSAKNILRQKYKNLIVRFAADLRNARPDTGLSTPNAVKRRVQREVVEIDSDDEPEPTPKRQKLPGRGVPSTPESSRNAAVRVKTEPNSGLNTPTKPKTSFTKSLTLAWIRERYQEGLCGTLPDTINPKVTEVIILACIGSWPELANRLLNGIRSLFDTMLNKTVQKTLEKYDKARLLPQTAQATSALFSSILDQQTAVIEHIVACELHRPTLHSEKKLKQETHEWQAELRRDRLEERIAEHFALLTAKSQSEKEVDALEKRKNEATSNAADWQKKNPGALGPDPFAFEVEQMATPLAYYDVASTQMVDTIAKHLELGLMHKLEVELPSALHNGLRIDDDQFCADLLAEDPRREARRRFLLSEQAKLMEAKQECLAVSHN